MSVGKEKGSFLSLTKFNFIRNDDLKDETTFNSRFLISYHGIHENVRASKDFTMFLYTMAQISYVSLYLKERDSLNLDALIHRSQNVA
jgi:hypothetical protein